ncbi:2'-5' RNA ligase family protein [Flavobacterium sangjuense]|uniref:RNA 2',3'-cyclic phosphodiesterase n=1 Tax=Flavobacterium sangjuense TaxID=2518177 RepID=A0A4P7PSZ8_9FLAO|nr:2'-5' RNA ligase family protein [Flavobacterium sangjuense]QBZ98057.1 hypothetical protein GS03_01562 [Flavobacterium sangjuense]
MKQIPLYSLVIFPTQEQIELVKSYKQLLKNKIGWFGSVDANAHITIIQFDNEMMLLLYIEKVREFCKTAVSQKVVLNKWDSFDPHTFFIAPDESSKRYLNKLITNLHEYLGFKINNVNAHMSIARKLDPERMKKAYDLFQNTEINLQFDCDAIFVRKFDGQQYSEITEKIRFAI